MAIKYNGQDVKHLKYNDNYCKQVIKNGVSVWAETAGTINLSLPSSSINGIYSFTVTRNTSNEPMATLGNINNNAVLYYGDTITITPSVKQYYRVSPTSLTKTIDNTSPKESIYYAKQGFSQIRTVASVGIRFINNILGVNDQTALYVTTQYINTSGNHVFFGDNEYNKTSGAILMNRLKVWEGSTFEYRCHFLDNSGFDDVYTYPLSCCYKPGSSIGMITVPENQLTRVWARYFAFDGNPVSKTFTDSGSAEILSSVQLSSFRDQMKLRLTGTVDVTGAFMTSTGVVRTASESFTQVIISSTGGSLCSVFVGDLRICDVSAYIDNLGYIMVEVKNFKALGITVKVTEIEMYGFLIDSNEKRWDYSLGGKSPNGTYGQYGCWDDNGCLWNDYCAIDDTGYIHYIGGFMKDNQNLLLQFSGTYCFTDTGVSGDLSSELGYVTLSVNDTYDELDSILGQSVSIVTPITITGYHPYFNGVCFNILMDEGSGDHYWEVVS